MLVADEQQLLQVVVIVRPDRSEMPGSKNRTTYAVWIVPEVSCSGASISYTAATSLVW